MNWYRENRWLGNFLIAFAVTALVALWFLFRANSGFVEASTQFNEAATERNRLEHLNPFPNEGNFRKTQAALNDYGATLTKLKGELRAQVLPVEPIAPNEFQSRLRRAIVNTTERARANRVKLPENFHLGFDEFRTTLPTTAAAPLLGQELAQVELLLGILIDARVDAIRGVVGPGRTPLPGPPSSCDASTRSSTYGERLPLHGISGAGFIMETSLAKSSKPLVNRARRLSRTCPNTCLHT